MKLKPNTVGIIVVDCDNISVSNTMLTSIPENYAVYLFANQHTYENFILRNLEFITDKIPSPDNAAGRMFIIVSPGPATCAYIVPNDNQAADMTIAVFAGMLMAKSTLPIYIVSKDRHFSAVAACCNSDGEEHVILLNQKDESKPLSLCFFGDESSQSSEETGNPIPADVEDISTLTPAELHTKVRGCIYDIRRNITTLAKKKLIHNQFNKNIGNFTAKQRALHKLLGDYYSLLDYQNSNVAYTSYAFSIDKIVANIIQIEIRTASTLTLDGINSFCEAMNKLVFPSISKCLYYASLIKTNAKLGLQDIDNMCIEDLESEFDNDRDTQSSDDHTKLLQTPEVQKVWNQIKKKYDEINKACCIVEKKPVILDGKKAAKRNRAVEDYRKWITGFRPIESDSSLMVLVKQNIAELMRNECKIYEKNISKITLGHITNFMTRVQNEILPLFEVYRRLVTDMLDTL